jgi:poly(beta-D-mannuronate) lyase
MRDRMGRMKLRSLSFQVFCAGLLVCVSAAAEQLRSPWETARTTPTDAAYACPAPPAFSRTLDLQGYYSDKRYSVIDAKRLAAFNDASEGPTHLGQYATNAADAWLSKGSRDAAMCVYSLLDAAAKADAWDNEMLNNNGVYLQNWMLSGTAVAYLKVRGSQFGTTEQDARIQKWFRLVANRVREYFDVQFGRPGSDAWNNHIYWAGLAVAAEGIADNDIDSLIWGIATYRIGIDAIQPDGSLAAEMGRGQKALHYQLYALGPLVMLAELGEANGIDLYATKNGAIHRLVQFNIGAMKDPSIISRRTGAAQDISKTYSGLEIGWAVPYIQRFPNAQLSTWMAQAPWLRFWQWGGTPPEAVSLPASEAATHAALQKALGRRVERVLNWEFPADHSESAAFFGEWCVEGNSAWHASISDKGNFILLTNESGDASVGVGDGPIKIVAPGWSSVGGKLTSDRTQIDWSNGTYWARCPSAPMPSPLSLTGKWFTNAGVQPCFIQQRGDQISIAHGKGCKATGQVDALGHLTTVWSGNRIDGVVTVDADHINWDNRTYWSRAKIYQSARN